MSDVPHAEPIFERFSIADLPTELNLQIKHRTLLAGEILFREGDPATEIYFLKSGSMRLLNYTKSGKTVDHYAVVAGELFAEVLMVMKVCTCTAVAEVVSEVLVIPKNAWIEALRTQQNLAIAFAGELTYRLHMLKITLQLRGIRFAKERVWKYLQIMAAPDTKVFMLNRPLKAIARDLDLTPETLSRVLSELTKEKIIQRDTKQIMLLE